MLSRSKAAKAFINFSFIDSKGEPESESLCFCTVFCVCNNWKSSFRCRTSGRHWFLSNSIASEVCPVCPRKRIRWPFFINAFKAAWRFASAVSHLVVNNHKDIDYLLLGRVHVLFFQSGTRKPTPRSNLTPGPFRLRSGSVRNPFGVRSGQFWTKIFGTKN